jgi:hypothetical protein
MSQKIEVPVSFIEPMSFELHADLLKIAEEVATPTLALFKGDRVVVISDNGNLAQIYYEGGTEEDFFTVKSKDLKPIPVKKDPLKERIRKIQERKTNVQAEAPDFIEGLRQHGTIRAQMPPQDFGKFAELMESLTGERLEEGSPHVSLVNEQTKWGVSLTVLFPKELAALAPSWLKPYQYVHSNPNVWAINNNAFAYELLASGFNLGNQHGEGPSVPLNP